MKTRLVVTWNQSVELRRGWSVLRLHVVADAGVHVVRSDWLVVTSTKLSSQRTAVLCSWALKTLTCAFCWNTHYFIAGFQFEAWTWHNILLRILISAFHKPLGRAFPSWSVVFKVFIFFSRLVGWELSFPHLGHLVLLLRSVGRLRAWGNDFVGAWLFVGPLTSWFCEFRILGLGTGPVCFFLFHYIYNYNLL